MSQLVWNETYSVGVETIDHQHKELFKIINGLAKTSKAGQTAKGVETALHELLEYTKMHFITEENLMSTYGYPEGPDHKKAHKDLIRQAITLTIKFNAGDVQVGKEMMIFLQNWLIDHIFNTDKKFGAFLNSKGFKD